MTRSFAPPTSAPRFRPVGSAARIWASVRPSGVQVAVQPTDAMVQSIVPSLSVVTASSVTSGVTVHPSCVSVIERSP